jgi:hypothetical protein
VGASGMIRTQMEKHNRSVMVGVYGTPYAIRASNSKAEVTALLMYRQYE